MAENNWRELCELIMKETDPERLLSLVEQLNKTLDLREQELRERVHYSPKSESGIPN